MKLTVFFCGVAAALAAQDRPVVAVVGETAKLAPLREQLEKRYTVVTVPVRGTPVFPPTGAAYKDDGEAHRAWRAIHLAAPDAVVMLDEYPGLVEALRGKAPVLRGAPLDKPRKSLLRLTMEERMRRTPRQVLEQLAEVYGRELKSVVYIPAFAVMGQLALGRRELVDRLVAPYLDGRQDSLAQATGSHGSGHLLFAALGQADRVKAAAAIVAPLHNEMSDSVFMACPILGAAGETEKAIAHLRFMEKLCLRGDGIYRHSPLDEAAWGRGNAFALLGQALLLETMAPPDERVLASFRALAAALLKRQDEEGMWHQVIDQPGSYAEFSATAMIAASYRKAIRAGWLPAASYQPAVEKAWRAVLRRTGADGVVMDVCESTGKQTSRQAYLDRAAIWGKDPRGGAMAMLLAGEMMKP
ncbi:MAG: glycoside hydrolase family 88 protein [Acidobacteriota bacterium]